MEQLSKEKLLEINNEIQAVLTKYGVALQPTMGISYVPLSKSDVVSPYNNNEPNPEAI